MDTRQLDTWHVYDKVWELVHRIVLIDTYDDLVATLYK